MSTVASDGAATGARIVGRVAVKATENAVEKVVGTKIAGYTAHGVEEAISREGHGVKASAILDAVRNPKKIVWKINQKGLTQTYFSKNAKAKINYFTRQIVTVVALTRDAFR